MFMRLRMCPTFVRCTHIYIYIYSHVYAAVNLFLAEVDVYKCDGIVECKDNNISCVGIATLNPIE